MTPGFANQWTQAGLLAALGKKDEAATTRDKAMALATEADLNTLGYQQLQGGKLDEAIATFKKNVEQNPKSWNACDSLAEAYATKGDKKQAADLYGKAMAMTSDDAQKKRISDILARIKA